MIQGVRVNRNTHGGIQTIGVPQARSSCLTIHNDSGTVGDMDRQKLERFGDYLRLRRVAGGNRNRAEYARSLGLRNDRVLNDLENGVRDNYSDDTLAAVDIWYGLAAGTAAQAIKEGEWDERAAAPIATPESPDVIETTTDTAYTASSLHALSVPGATVVVNVVRAKAAAVGVEFEATYTDADDRERALQDITKALAAIVRSGEIRGSDSAQDLLESDDESVPDRGGA